MEWLVRPLELGRSVPIAFVDTVEGGDLQARVLERIRLSAVALPEGVEVATFGVSLTWPGGGLGGGLAPGAPLEPGAIDPGPARIHTVLTARLEAVEGAASVDLEGPIQWRLELGSEASGRLDMLSDVASRLAVPLIAPSTSATSSSPASSPRGGGKLRAAAFAGGRTGEGFVMLAVIPRGGSDGGVGAPGPGLVARSADGGRSWELGALRLAGREGPWEGPIEGPALLFDDRTGTFRLLCGIPASPGAPAPGGTQVSVLESADGGLTWSSPGALELPGVGLDGAGAELDLSACEVVPSGGRGVAASGGEWLWPLEIRGPGDARRYALLREARGGGASLSTLGPGGRWAASFVELGDGAVLVSAASLRQPGREFRLWRELDAAWRAPLRVPDPSLPCAGGAAALMHVGRELAGSMDGRLVSANAAVRRKPPARMSIRGSNDGGQRWPAHREVLLDDGRAVGGPGLAMADADSVGVVYRASSGSVVFQSVPLDELVDPIAGIGSVTGGR